MNELEKALSSLLITTSSIGERYGEDSSIYASYLQSCGLVFSQLGKTEDAEKYLLQAADIWRAANDVNIQSSLQVVAQFYINSQRYDQARPVLEECLENVCQFPQGNYPQAISAALDQLTNLPQAQDNSAYYALLRRLAEINLDRKYFDIVVLLYREIARLQSVDASLELCGPVRTYWLLGLLYQKINDWQAARECFKMAESFTFKRFDDGQGSLYTDDFISQLHYARLCHQLGEYSEAGTTYDWVINFAGGSRGLEFKQILSIALVLMYEFQIEIGNHEKAARILDKVNKAILELPESSEKFLITIRRNITFEPFLQQEAAEDVLKAYPAIMKIVSKIENASHADSLLGELLTFVSVDQLEIQSARLYKQINDIESADTALKNTISRLEMDGTWNILLAQALKERADCSYLKGDYETARGMLIRAVASLLELFDKVTPQLSDYYTQLAYWDAEQQRYADAFDWYYEAVVYDEERIRQVFSFLGEEKRAVFLNQCQTRLANLLALAQLCPAESQMIPALCFELVLKRKGLSTEASLAQRTAILGGQYSEGAVEVNFRQAEMLKNPTIGSSRNYVPSGNSLNDMLMNNMFARVRSQMAEIEWGFDDFVTRQVIETRLEYLKDVSVESVAAALPEHSVLIEYVQYEPEQFIYPSTNGSAGARILAFVLPASQPDKIVCVSLGKAEFINKLISDFQYSLNVNASGRQMGAGEEETADTLDFQKAGIVLRQAVFDVLGITPEFTMRVFIAPDGNLSLIPFEVLPTSHGFMIDSFIFSYLSTGRDLIRGLKASATSHQPSVVIAAPDYDLTGSGESRTPMVHMELRSADLFRTGLHFTDLKGTLEEGTMIAGLLKVPLIHGREALEMPIKKLASPFILHLATHGFFIPDQGFFRSSGLASKYESADPSLTMDWENPLLRSGLALAGVNTFLNNGELPPEALDGLLTAADVLQMNLVGTELVVLSACETGLGEVQIGEGVIGLRRAFLLAGAHTLVISLWKVPDQQTQELMNCFYQNLRAGQSRVEALRDAQLSLRKKYAHPLFWGAFICQGFPGPLTWD